VEHTARMCKPLAGIECYGQSGPKFKKYGFPCVRYSNHYFLSTLLFSIFLGLLGIDRFCLGHTGTGNYSQSHHPWPRLSTSSTSQGRKSLCRTASFTILFKFHRSRENVDPRRCRYLVGCGHHTVNRRIFDACRREQLDALRLDGN
jgi:hypothetical protein